MRTAPQPSLSSSGPNWPFLGSLRFASIFASRPHRVGPKLWLVAWPAWDPRKWIVAGAVHPTTEASETSLSNSCGTEPEHIHPPSRCHALLRRAEPPGQSKPRCLVPPRPSESRGLIACAPVNFNSRSVKRARSLKPCSPLSRLIVQRKVSLMKKVRHLLKNEQHEAEAILNFKSTLVFEQIQRNPNTNPRNMCTQKRN